MEQNREGKFTVRIFSKKDVCVEPVTETRTVVSGRYNCTGGLYIHQQMGA